MIRVRFTVKYPVDLIDMVALFAIILSRFSLAKVELEDSTHFWVAVDHIHFTPEDEKFLDSLVDEEWVQHWNTFQ